jgi:leucyl aminopeptidase
MMLMIITTISSEPALSHKAQCAVFFAHDLASATAYEAVKRFPEVAAVLEQKEFKGAVGSVITVPVMSDNTLIYVVIAGVGPRTVTQARLVEHYRRALGAVVKAAIANKCATIALMLPNATSFNLSVAELVEQTVSTAFISAYHFDEFITDEDRKEPKELNLTIVVKSADQAEAKAGVVRGEIIGKAVNKARYWVDLPPTVLTPPALADKAQKIADDNGLKITVFNEEQINEMGMGGLAAVSRGSELDCRLAILEYSCGKTDVPTLGFVGKGITFDSGGLSIKPANSMETMKEDMAGAAAVIAAMEAIAILKPEINIVAITPLAENMPNGNAVKPGDIVRFYNGKTAEIKNTDAEGRLILADALAYAVKHYKLDALVDLATLTGACSYALGPFYSGMLSVHDDVVEKLQRAADKTGDRVWRLPLDDDYKKAIQNPVADISNTGSPKIMAGTITAAFFLKNFVDDVPWVHLDIAGTAFDVPDMSYFRSGATGYGVRLLVELATGWQK